MSIRLRLKCCVTNEVVRVQRLLHPVHLHLFEDRQQPLRGRRSHRWFASHISVTSSPIDFRTARERRTSSRQSGLPTLIFTRFHPSSISEDKSRTSSASERFSQPASVLYA